MKTNYKVIDVSAFATHIFPTLLLTTWPSAQRWASTWKKCFSSFLFTSPVIVLLTTLRTHPHLIFRILSWLTETPAIIHYARLNQSSFSSSIS
jgi:hypothetical protein